MAQAGARTRITAGEWRGRLVDTPRSGPVRPTTALVRKALFDILGDRVVDARVVDLYAGTGAVSFEALSRGAAHVTAVDHDRGLLRLIDATAERLGGAARVRTIGADAATWVRARPRDLERADICFVDAPYRDDGVLDVLDALGVNPPALVVCEHHRARRLPETIGRLRQVRTAVYGTTQLTFFAPHVAAPTDEEPPAP